VEALQRIVSAFPSETQNAVRAQLADCVVAVICQRLRFRPELKIRVPECEILVPTTPIKAHIRNGDFFKIVSTMETGAEHGMWTFARYQTWMESKKNWYIPSETETPDTEAPPETMSQERLAPAGRPKTATVAPAPVRPASPHTAGRPIEIEPIEGGLDELLKKLE